MCFSASASFAAGGGLAVIGAASVQQAKKEQRLVAFIPFLFALQQLLEGGQWIVQHPSKASFLLGYGFLFVAFLVWPIYLPLAAYQQEKNQTRKSLLRWFIAAGVLTALGCLYALWTQPLVINILPKGIDYHVMDPLGGWGVLWYVTFVCGSMLISSHVFLRWFGIAGVAAFILSTLIFLETLTSVWCFFAALLSVMVYFFIRQENKKKR